MTENPLPHADTLVAYPGGDTESVGVVLHVEELDGGRSGVILDRTAFHPVDTAWPDQPADRGALVVDGTAVPIVDAVIGAIHEGELHVGAEVPVRTGTEGWVFTVVHIVEGELPQVGAQVRVEVDRAHRTALSAGHTACHLASLALDAALAEAWTKDVAADALGNPAFDSLAIQSSRIAPHGSTDLYRVGKSLRKKGFDPTALDDLAGVQRRANAQLAEWVAGGAQVRVERADESLTARRSWVCDLPGGTAVIPCGGTHVTSLSDLGTVTVALETRAVSGGVELEMRTTVEG